MEMRRNLYTRKCFQKSRNWLPMVAGTECSQGQTWVQNLFKHLKEASVIVFFCNKLYLRYLTRFWIHLWSNTRNFLYVELNGTKYSRMNQVTFVEDSLKKFWRGIVCFKFFKDCSPQILLGLFLNTLTRMQV